MSNARPKYKLKEGLASPPATVAETPAPQGWKNIFQQAKGALVPVRTTDPRIVQAQAPDRTATKNPTRTPAPQLTRKTEAPKQTLNRAVREKRSYVSVLPPAPQPKSFDERDLSLTRGGQTLIADENARPHVERDVSPRVLAESKNKLAFAAIALLVVGGVFLLRAPVASLGTNAPTTALPEHHSAIDGKTLQQDVQYFRHSTGWKLNSDRVHVQQQNDTEAPPLALDEHKVKAPDVMDGVPLQGESPARANAHDRLVMIPPNDTEANVMYQLQDEQAAARWEKEAQDAYIHDFISNARAQGVVVRVDSAGNVILDEAGTKKLHTPPKGYWINTDDLPAGAQGAGH